MIKNYSFELSYLDESLTPYGTIETHSPTTEITNITDFRPGDHFRTMAETGTNSLTLQLEDRILTLIVDKSGSMTWNDNNGDRYTYSKRLLKKLQDTYPGNIKTNLIGFGGELTKTTLFVAQSSVDLIHSTSQDFANFLQQSFEDSVYDFAGVRVMRRTDTFPSNPSDGVLVADGIFESVKDENLQEGKTYYYSVWTYNKDRHFSRGKNIKAAPYGNNLPKGVNFATATPRILPGAQRDQYIQELYNFKEQQGPVVLDSSGNSHHGIIGSQVILDNFWAGDSTVGSFSNGSLKSSVGARFDGEFDIVETDISDGKSNYTATQSITVSFWVYRYARLENKDVWVLGTSNSADIGWAIGFKNSGNIALSTNSIIGGFSTDTGVFVPQETWTMVSVVFSNPHALIYINDSLQTTVTLPPPITNVNFLTIGAKLDDSGSVWGGLDFFGILSLVSISNINRDNTYISKLYNQENPIFNKTLITAANVPADNKQREVLLSWFVDDSFSGIVKIIRKYRDIPSNEEDGDIITSVDVSGGGQFYFVDAFDFINNGDYYYRIFTYNISEIPCDRSEARILPVHIQYSDNTGDTLPPPISGETAIPGNGKVMLQWSSPPGISGVKLFFGDKEFPTVSRSSIGNIEVTNGTLITDTSLQSYIHRSSGTTSSGTSVKLINGHSYFYTIVTYDQHGNISTPVFLVAVPSSNLATVFNSDDVADLHYSIVNPITLSIQWINPTIKSDTLDLFFGDSSLIYVNVNDIYGGTLEDISNLQLQVCTKITKRALKAMLRYIHHQQFVFHKNL